MKEHLWAAFIYLYSPTAPLQLGKTSASSVKVSCVIQTEGRSALRREQTPLQSQVSAKVGFHMIYSSGKLVDVYYSRLTRGDGTDKEVKSDVKPRLFAKALVADPSSLLVRMLPVRGAGEHLQLSSFVFLFLIFVYPGRACLFFRRRLKFTQA